MSKVCIKCQRDQGLWHYNDSKQHSSGINNTCQGCANAARDPRLKFCRVCLTWRLVTDYYGRALVCKVCQSLKAKLKRRSERKNGLIKCTHCRDEKVPCDFYKSDRSKSGRKGKCKLCWHAGRMRSFM